MYMYVCIYIYLSHSCCNLFPLVASCPKRWYISGDNRKRGCDTPGTSRPTQLQLTPEYVMPGKNGNLQGRGGLWGQRNWAVGHSYDSTWQVMSTSHSCCNLFPLVANCPKRWYISGDNRKRDCDTPGTSRPMQLQLTPEYVMPGKNDNLHLFIALTCQPKKSATAAQQHLQIAWLPHGLRAAFELGVIEQLPLGCNAQLSSIGPICPSIESS